MYAFIYTCKCYMFYTVVNFTVLSPKQCINEVLFKQKSFLKHLLIIDNSKSKVVAINVI